MFSCHVMRFMIIIIITGKPGVFEGDMEDLIGAPGQPGPSGPQGMPVS